MTTNGDVDIRDAHIGDFKQDDQNARVHNPRNVGTIEHSLQRVGAARSLVSTNDDVIIAGNATLDAAAAAGIEHAIVVTTRGDALIIHKRADIESGSLRATELALYDNRASDLSTFDPERILEIRETYPDILGPLWSDEEFDRAFRDLAMDQPILDASAQLGDLQYKVVVDVNSEQQQAELLAEFAGRGLSCRALIS